MDEYRPLRTNNDLMELREVCKNFENPAHIVTMNQAPDTSKIGYPDMECYISGNDIPMVKIVFRYIFSWKIDSAPIVAIEFKINGNFHLLRLWHEYSTEDAKAATTSWILADSIDWKCVEDQFDQP